MDDPIYVMRLIIGWTCVGVFIATALASILDLFGFMRLGKDIRSRLHAVLLIEVVAIGISVFAGLVKIDPTPVQDTLENQRENSVSYDELIPLSQESKTNSDITLCSESEHCQGTPVGCIIAGDDSDWMNRKGQLMWTDAVLWAESWSNTPCGTSGRGWVVGGGSCGDDPNNPPSGTLFDKSGLKRCQYAVVRQGGPR
jgi:hypothetical protein